ncbi:MAG TPA: response regulator transcription factor [Terriglobales bacterium]|jgi:DNA-binding NarL/FixJ family response regulator
MQTSSPAVIHVLVADNARMYTQLLADALGRDPQIRVVSAPSDSKSIQEEVKHHKNLDIVVLGSNLDEIQLHGIALFRELRMMRPEIRGIILLDSSKREVILEAFRSGARGLFSRNESLETFSKCVRQVHAGQIWANSEQMSYAVEALALAPNIKAVDANGLNILSKREIEVVRSLAEGLTNREIAVRLGLSQHTIKNYLFRIFDKLGVSSRMELMFLTLNQNVSGRPSVEITQEAGSEAVLARPLLEEQKIDSERSRLQDQTQNNPARGIFKVQSV